jgi:hypothetical protein
MVHLHPGKNLAAGIKEPEFSYIATCRDASFNPSLGSTHLELRGRVARRIDPRNESKKSPNMVAGPEGFEPKRVRVRSITR